jgi:hypothetical protein
MELVDRYLQAVKFWLPKNQKQDIIAELSEDLHSQIEEQEGALGHPLNESEIAAILKKCGPPMLVAQRYQPQRYLIGPGIFPIYSFVLKLNWICIFGPWLVSGICLNIFVAANRTGHYGALTSVLDHFWTAALANLFVITTIFALLDRYQPQDGLWANWNPQRLPKVRDVKRIPRSSSISELAWYGMLLLWWTGVFHLPAVSGLRIESSPVISRFFFWPILVLLLGQVVMTCINAFRPWWTPARAMFRGFVDALGLIIVSILLAIRFSGGSFVAITSAKLSSSEIAAGQYWITWGWVVMLLLWAEIGFLARLIQDSRRATGREPLRNWALQLFTGD